MQQHRISRNKKTANEIYRQEGGTGQKEKFKLQKDSQIREHILLKKRTRTLRQNIKQRIIYKVRHIVDLKNNKKYLNRRKFDRMRENDVINAVCVYILCIPGVSF